MKLFNSIMKRAIDRDTAQNLGFNRIMIAQFYEFESWNPISDTCKLVLLL